MDNYTFDYQGRVTYLFVFFITILLISILTQKNSTYYKFLKEKERTEAPLEHELELTINENIIASKRKKGNEVHCWNK